MPVRVWTVVVSGSCLLAAYNWLEGRYDAPSGPGGSPAHSPAAPLQEPVDPLDIAWEFADCLERLAVLEPGDWPVPPEGVDAGAVERIDFAYRLRCRDLLRTSRARYFERHYGVLARERLVELVEEELALAEEFAASPASDGVDAGIVRLSGYGRAGLAVRSFLFALEELFGSGAPEEDLP